MNTQKVSDWMQIVIGMGVLVGIALVIWELDQGHDIAVNEALASDFSKAMSQYQSILGEDPAATIAKACRSPDTLDLRDTVILVGYFNSRLMTPLQQTLQYKRASLGFDSWRRSAYPALFTILGTSFGRFWWAGIRDSYDSRIPGIAALSDSILQEMGDEYPCDSLLIQYQDWRSKLSLDE